MTEKEQFVSDLLNLETRFNALKPELELCVRDHELDVEGFVVVWNTNAAVGGPLGRCGKGGTRITPTVTLAEVEMLARIMTLKNAAAGLPLGGAKSGVRADPNSPQFEKQYRRVASMVKPILKENGGIFGGFGFDIGGKPEHVGWICDELGSRRSFTGKPLAWGGTDYDRQGIAGLGVAVAARTMVAHRKSAMKDVTFSVQGVGAMGAAVVKYFSEMGARLVAISDPRIGGTVRLPSADPQLIDAIARWDIAELNRMLTKMKAVSAPLHAIIEAPCDIFFPCALQDVVNEANVDLLKVSAVVEGANNPLSAGARTRLAERGVTVIPDFIANPGGIIAAFVEITSTVSDEENLKGAVKANEAKRLTETKIAENVSQVLSYVERLGIEPSHAGKYLALRRIFPG